MEAQRLSYGLSLPTSPTQSHKNPSFHRIKTPSLPNNHTLKGFFKTHFPFSPQILPSKKILQCTSCLQRLESEGVTGNSVSMQRLESEGVTGNSVSKQVKKKKLAVFVSGGGSNFKSIYEATIEGIVHGEVAVLVASKPDCGGAKYARDKGIPVILFPKTKDSSEGLSKEELVAALRTYNTDFILLAGYLKLIPTELVQAFPRSILNIHPSLLPAFGGKGCYGMKVHKAVIASGARYSGPTIHYVDEHYDTGRILAQRAVPVLANDTAETLAARVLQEEHKLYVEVAAALCEERIVWRQDGVPLIQSKEDPHHYK